MQIPPLHRRLATTVGLCVLLLTASGFIPERPTDTDIQKEDELTFPPEPSPTDEFALPPPVENSEPPTAQVEQRKTTVRNGDNMAMIFANNGFSARTLHELTQTEHGKVLADIFPGAGLTFESKKQQLTS